jgi:hypothetical protein
VWQQVYRRIARPDVELVAVGIDRGGAEALRPHVEAAGATFPVLVDSTGLATSAFEFKAVPNGLLVDEALTVRYRKDGGFKNENPPDLDAVERFMRGEDPGPSPAPKVPYELGTLERRLRDLHMRHGDLLASLGRTHEAVAEWQDALALDPENLTIRKPIWMALHPDRFHPTIDREWQREQLRREREAEVAAGICGPDGCPLPPRAPAPEPAASASM